MSNKRKDQLLTTAERKFRFFKHLRTYLAMSIFFVLLNIVTSAGYFWAIYPILGWGLGIVMEYFSLFGPWRDADTYPDEVNDYDPLDLDTFPDRSIETQQPPSRPSYRKEDLI